MQTKFCNFASSIRYYILLDLDLTFAHACVRKRGSLDAMQALLSINQNFGVTSVLSYSTVQHWLFGSQIQIATIESVVKKVNSIPARPSRGWLLPWQIDLVGDQKATWFLTTRPIFKSTQNSCGILSNIPVNVGTSKRGQEAWRLFFNAPSQ